MRRRGLLLVLAAGAAALRPLAAAAPPRDAERAPRIGILDDGPLWDYFRDRLRDLGYLDGHNLAIEYRSGEGDPDRLRAAAAELARLPVDVIAAAGSTAAKAAQAATDAVPIVAIRIGDPVAIGLAKSRTRPGGNVTGNMTIRPDLAAKRLQLLKSMLPHLSRVAYFWNPNNASSRVFLDQLRAAARSLDLTITAAEARSPAEFEKALAAIASSRAEAMVTSGDAVQQQHLEQIVDFQLRQRLPGMFTRREDVLAGGLVSYGISVPDLYRRGADTAHKILRGAKPAELPFEQPEKFEMVMNLRTAEGIGLAIPRSIVAAADEIIE